MLLGLSGIGLGEKRPMNRDVHVIVRNKEENREAVAKGTRIILAQRSQQEKRETFNQTTMFSTTEKKLN